MTETEAAQATQAPDPKRFDVDFVKTFMFQNRGKWVITYAGLIHKATEEAGLVGIEVNVLQYPSDQNGQTTICRADVRLEKDGRVKTFTEIGDANPGNVAKPMAPHSIRMAATRAKARALRDALDVGFVTLEELAEAGEDVQPQGQPQAQNQPQRQPQAQPKPNGSNPRVVLPREADLATPNQVRAIYSIAADQRGMDENRVDQHCQALYGGACPAELSKRQATDFIEWLRDKSNGASPAPAQNAPAANGTPKPAEGPNDYYELDINGQTWRVPVTFRTLDNQQLEVYRAWVRLSELAENLGQLRAAWDRIREPAEKAGDPRFTQIKRVFNRRKAQIEEAAKKAAARAPSVSQPEGGTAR